MKTSFYYGVAALALISACPALAQEAPKASGNDTITEVVVLGHGQARQTQQIKAAELLQATPGTSPLKVLDKLPGVTFQSADPFGAYEWSTRISVRGFNQNQMGFTLDGITLGDMSYGNYNGLHISRAIINEDISSVDITQGAGSLSAATSSNLGGTLQFTSRDPSRDMGGDLSATGGSKETYRIFGRLETGAIAAAGGLRGYISAVDQKSNKWKGGSQQRARQFDTKWVLPLGEGSLTGFVNHSERREQDYQDLSIAQINAGGYNIDNFQPNWAAAVGVASVLNNPALYYSGQLNPASGYWTGVGVNPYKAYGVNTPDDSYYYGAGIRNDTISGLKLNLPLTDTVRLDTQVYHHENKGQGLWATPYSVSPNYGVAGATTDNAPISIRTTEYGIKRTGFTGALTFNLGANTLSTGVWYEDNDFNQARRYYAEDLAAPKRNPLGFQSNPYATAWAYKFNTKTEQFFVEDIYRVNDALKLNAGFKSLKVTSTALGTVPAAPLSAKLTSKDSIIPQAGFVYKFQPGLEAFGTYSENMGAFVAAATAGPFASRSQANVNYVATHLKPETSKTTEGGLRFRIPGFQGVAALYHVDFDHRILGIAQGPGIVGNAPVLSNVGAVKTDGMELAGTWRFLTDWKLYGAYSYNTSKYDNNVVDSSGAVVMATKGKTVVNTPKNLVKSELSYDDGQWFGAVSIDYTDARYNTYTNIGGKAPAYTLAEFNMGYRFTSIGTELQLNISNLTNKKYISTINSNGFTVSDPTNSFATVLSGAPRQVFLSLRKHF